MPVLSSPLSRAQGLGSGRNGTIEWWRQRLSALMITPLSLWFVAALIRMPHLSYAEMIHWFKLPWNAIALIALICIGSYHTGVGLGHIIEDYVHVAWQKRLGQVLLRCLIAAVACINLYAVLAINLGH